MPIQNDEELADAAIRAGALLQEIQDYMQDQSSATARVRFPRGVMRTAAHFRSAFPRYMPYDRRTTCAYGLMYFDAMWWLTHRTDLAGVAQEMCFKSMIITLGTVLEATLRIPGEPSLGGGGAGVKQRLDTALQRNWVTQADADLLKQLWDHRNNVHAHVLGATEFGLYRLAHVDAPARALRLLVRNLKTWDDARA